MTAQDAHIAGYVAEAFCGLVLVANKWDLVGGDGSTARSSSTSPGSGSASPPGRPLLRLGEGAHGAPALLEQPSVLGEERRRRIPTAELNALVERATAEKPPRRRGAGA